LIDNCVAVGAKSLLLGGIGQEKLVEAYYKVIAETCDYAAEKGLPITVKPHGGLNATGPQCRKCVEMAGHKNFSLWYDPGNIYFYSDGQRNPVEDAATVDGLVTVGLCIKDFDRPVMDGKPTRTVAITPGTGMVDFRKVLAVLKRGGFTSGYLVIECLADAATGTGHQRRFARQLVGHTALSRRSAIRIATRAKLKISAASTATAAPNRT